ncbi:ABC transporter substrate-binding protein [Clostridium sp. D2Q-11]|uniref:ABC transporter substrate-binding protein n=1 Tax=Anaeromonas frigoriresistens TaxID=2683708 RepID=A0A942UUT6_9FIRM|nr:ABC transporter substrate-binding protein [Anaeromonas frigoriresistens]MBS4537266.1 ABC transporter substrate-binding protein [Anaeromonas frigoriresistens]
MIKKIISLMIIFSIILSISVGCDTESIEQSKEEELRKVTVLLDWVPNTNHTGLYVAKNKGYYEDAGLDVEIIQPPEGGTADLIAAGQGDFGISYQEEVTYARTSENPLPIKAIAAIIQNNTSGFASPKDRDIETPKDFEGKKYGGWGAPMEESTIKALMEKDGGDFSKVEMVNIGALDFFTAVKEHVDFTWIYYGWDGVAAEIKDSPINFIKLQEVDENLDFYTPAIIAKESILEGDPELVKDFLAATTKGYEFAIENPEDAVESLLADNSEIDREIAIESQKYLASEYQADAARWGEMRLEKWENYANWMYERELIEKELYAEEAFTNEFLPEK